MYCQALGAGAPAAQRVLQRQHRRRLREGAAGGRQHRPRGVQRPPVPLRRPLPPQPGECALLPQGVPGRVATVMFAQISAPVPAKFAHSVEYLPAAQPGERETIPRV